MTVTYTAEVTDEATLRRAGSDAWQPSTDSWGVRETDDGIAAAHPEERDAVRPGIDASIAFVLGQQPRPQIPGAQITATSIDVHRDEPT